ncbi:MAG: 5-formyltetrahydrofolate cyclo-ligase [Pseudomonadota bacterium]
MRARKASERRLALARRDFLPPAVRAIMSHGIGRRLLALGEFRRSRGVMFYLSFRSEVETPGLIDRARALGKEIAVPLVRARSLVPCRYTTSADLAPSELGIMEPRPECACPVPPAGIDLILVPGTAFDARGNRLGYGQGYYDRLLADAPEALRVALAFECQLLPSVTAEPHDLPMDVILTEERCLRTSARPVNR